MSNLLDMCILHFRQENRVFGSLNQPWAKVSIIQLHFFQKEKAEFYIFDKGLR
jgi:hypothetical protein